MPRRLPRRLIERLRRRLRRPAVRSRRSYRLPMEGLVFVGVTLLIGLAAVNTGAQLLYLVFGMMCAFWILSDILATTSMRGLRIERVAPRLAVARQPVRVAVRLRNIKTLFASHSLRVGDWLRGDALVGSAFVARLTPATELTVEYRCVFPRRGIYRFERLVLATRFPFGLIQRTLTVHDQWEILVLPATIAIDRAMRQARTELGDYDSQMKGRGTSLYGIREYHAGESARDIHWKVSARTGTLMLREYESEERRRATVVLDNRLARGADVQAEGDLLEKAIVLANSVIGYLIDRSHEVELLTATGKVAFGSGPQHLMRCRRALASLGHEPPHAPPPELHGIEEGAALFTVQLRDEDSIVPDSIVMRVREHDDELTQAIGDLGMTRARLRGIEHL